MAEVKLTLPEIFQIFAGFTFDVLDVSAWIEEWQFQGFDFALIFMTIVRRYAAKNGLPSKTQAEISAIVKKSDFQMYILNLVVVFFLRGNLTKSMVLRMKPETALKLSSIKSILDIVDTPVANDDITLARVVNVFPLISVQGILSIGPNAFRDPVGPASPLPHFLRFPGAAAIIPHKCTDMLKDYLVWNTKLSVILVTKKEGKGKTKAYNIIMASHDSTFMSEDSRVKSLTAIHDQYAKRWGAMANPLKLGGGPAPTAADYDAYLLDAQAKK